MDMPDLIFVSLEDWDDVWRRNQFLCAELARRFPSMKILFVGLPIDVSNAIKRGRVRALFRERIGSPPGLPGIRLAHPLKLAPQSLSVGSALNDVMFRAHVRRAARRMGLRRPLLWLNPHSAVHLAGRMGESGVVYDITDDWTLADFPERDLQRIRAQDRALCRRADLTIVCSEALAQSRMARSRRLLLLPNGVNVEHYRTVGAAPAERRDRAPVLGYTGTLHPGRIDVALLEAVARRFADGSIVLIGPNHLPPGDTRRLEALGNVRLTGPAPYERLPGLMSAFDVCIVPHLETAFTESLNPIKLWEYLAAGKPIVSTRVAGFRDYPGLVRLASDADGFADACRAAAAERDPARVAERRAEAARHTWAARVDRLLQELAACDLIAAPDRPIWDAATRT